MSENKKFEVYTISTFEKPGYRHWSDGLSMFIKKGDQEMELDSEEVQKIVKSLPRTMGGQY